MRAIKKILAFFIYAIPLFALASCYVGGTPCIESAEWESDKELSLCLSGQPSDYDLAVEVSVSGKKDGSYNIKYTVYNPFTFKIKVTLNKSVPKGAFVTVMTTEHSSDLNGSITLEKK